LADESFQLEVKKRQAIKDKFAREKVAKEEEAARIAKIESDRIAAEKARIHKIEIERLAEERRVEAERKAEEARINREKMRLLYIKR